MLPLVVTKENLIFRFNYWCNGIREGMTYQNELYVCLAKYDVKDRMVAYAKAYERAEEGAVICISVSDTAYTLWANLRSQINAEEVGQLHH